MNNDPMICIHSAAGLCRRCRELYEEDPEAWIEYGNHSAGIRRRQEMQEEIDAERDRARANQVDNDLPL